MDSLHSESIDDELDGIIEETNLVEARIRLGNRSFCEIREQVYINQIISRFNNKMFRQHFSMTRITYENLERRLAPALM